MQTYYPKARLLVVYEFVVECRDEHGDIIDTIPWDTAEQAVTSFLREVQGGEYHRVEVAIVRDEWRGDLLEQRTHFYADQWAGVYGEQALRAAAGDFPLVWTRPTPTFAEA